MSNKRLKVSHTSGSMVPPMSISDLPNDVLKHCFSFIPGCYVTTAPVSRQFHRNYCTVGIDDNLTTLSTDVLLKVGKNRRTTVETVSNDIKLTEYCFIIDAPEDFMIKVCLNAMLKGDEDVLKCTNIFGIDFSQVMRYKNFVMEKLVTQGNLRMIQYFDSKNLFEDVDGDDWRDSFDKAADLDHLNIMKWIYQEKYKSYSYYMKCTIEAYEHVLEGVTAPTVTRELCEKAVEHGNIQVLEYCHRNNYRFDTAKWLCKYSMENKDKEQALVTLKWLRQHGCPWDESLCRAAASNDNLEVLKWAKSEGFPLDQAIIGAAEKGNIATIKYCLQNECPMTVEVCSSAMDNEDHKSTLETLKFLRSHSCPWDASTCHKAIENNNFEAMFWAKRHGCPWTKGEYTLLLKEGHVSVFEEVLRDESTDESLEGTINMIQEIVRSIHVTKFLQTQNHKSIIQTLKLFRKYGYEWDAKTSIHAAKQGQLRVLQWLRHMGCPMDANLCTTAVQAGNLDILKYVHENVGCKLSKEAYGYCFDREGLDAYLIQKPKHEDVRHTHTKILEYLEKNNCPIATRRDWKNLATRNNFVY